MFAAGTALHAVQDSACAAVVPLVKVALFLGAVVVAWLEGFSADDLDWGSV